MPSGYRVSGRTESKFSAVGRTIVASSGGGEAARRTTRRGLSLDWVAIVATTTVGTTMAAFCDRSLGIGYVGGSALLSTLLMPVWACNGCEMPQDGQYPS
jgi:hypothetical protein